MLVFVLNFFLFSTVQEEKVLRKKRKAERSHRNSSSESAVDSDGEEMVSMTENRKTSDQCPPVDQCLIFIHELLFHHKFLKL